MRCDEIQERFVELLYDEAGTPPASAELRAHVDSCPACRAELEELLSVRRALATWKDEPPLRSVARARPRERSAPASGPWLLRAARYGALAAMALLTFLALANAEITWNRDGFSFRTHLFAARPDTREFYTRTETRDLVRRALDDTERRLSEEAWEVGQRVLDTVDNERIIQSRLGRSRVNN